MSAAAGIDPVTSEEASATPAGLSAQAMPAAANVPLRNCFTSSLSTPSFRVAQGFNRLTLDASGCIDLTSTSIVKTAILTFLIGASVDTTDEPDEVVTLTISEDPDNPLPDGFSIDANSAFVTIRDDDPTLVELARAGTGAVREGGTVEFTVTLGRDLVAGEAIDVPLSIGGTDVDTDDWSLALKTGAGLNTGVALSGETTATPQLAFSGAAARTATLTLTALLDDDAGAETLVVALGPDDATANGFDRDGLATNVGGGADPSPTANRFEVTVNDPPAPAAPAGLSAAAGDGRAVLSWTDPSNAAIGGYEFRQRTPPDTGSWGTWTAIAGSTAATTTHTVTGLTNGTAYGFEVRAVSGGVAGAASSEATATPTAAGVATATTDGEATEGSTTDTAAFTVVLNTVPSSNVTVTVTAPAGLTLDGPDGATAFTDSEPLAFTTSNWSTAQTVTVRATDDSADSPIGRELKVTWASTSSDTDYNSLSGDAATVTVVDNDPTTVTLAGSAGDVVEGGTKTFTITLNRGLVNGETLPVPLTFGGTATRGTDYTTACPTTLPTGVACANLDSGNAMVTFTGPSTGTTATTVTLTLSAATDNTAESGGETVVIGLGTLNANSGTGLGGGASGTDSLADFSINDPDTTAPTVEITGVPDRISGTGDLTATFTFSEDVTGFATDDVTVTGGTKGAFTATSATVYTLAVTPAGGSNVVVTVAEDSATDGTNTGPASAETATAVWTALVFSSAAVTVVEEASATYTVALSSQPDGNVTVTVGGASGEVTFDTDDDMAGTQTTALTFSTTNWSTARTVTVLAAADNDTANDSATLTHTAAGGGYDSVTGDVAVTVTDNDTPGLVLDPTALTVAEGGSGTYTVALATQPTGTVTVTVAGASGEVTVDTDTGTPNNQSTLTFTDSTWSTARTVTVSAGEDNDTADDSATLTHSATGGGYGSVTGSVAVTVDDDDAAAPVPPAAPTGLAATAGDGRAVLSWDAPASDEITKWQYQLLESTRWIDIPESDATTRSHTVAGLVNGSTYNIRVRAVAGDVNGRPSAPVGARPLFGVAVLSPASLTVAEGGSATYTVRLSAEPGGTRNTNVIVGISSSNSDVTVSPAGLDFTVSNWNEPRTVTVSASQDNDAVDDRATLSHSVQGGGYTAGSGPDLNLVVNDDESGAPPPPAVQTNTAPTVATPIPDQDARVGAPFSHTFPADTFNDADGDPLTYSATGLPAWLGFDPGTRTFSGTPAAVGAPEVTVTASDGNGGSVSDTFAIAISAASADPVLTIRGGPAVAEGAAASFTVTADSPPNSNLTVNRTVADAPGADFLADGVEGSGTWTFPGGQTSRTFTIETEADGVAEPNGPVRVTLVAGMGYTLGGASTAAVTVNDDDGATPPPRQPPSSGGGGGGGGGGVAPPPPDPAIAAAGVTATGATLTVDGVSGVWHYRRTRPEGGECSGPQSGESAVLAGLVAATEYAYGLYSDSACSNELASVGFTTPAPPPSIAATGVTDTGATLTAANVPGGVWRHRRTLPEGGECSGPQSGESAVLAGLVAATEYAYGLYADSACSNELASVGFTTPAPPPSIAATGVTDTGATLTAANVPGGVWRHRRTLPEGGECSGPQSGESAVLAGLVAATEYAYGLYADSACSNELASVGFTTPAPPPSIAATGVTDTGATLTAANVPGGVWRHRRTLPEGGECSGPQSGESAALAGLMAATEYAYGLYADSACAEELASVGFTTGPSTNAALAGLALATRAGGAAALAPAFSPEADAYSAALPFAADSALLTPRTAHPDATARVGPPGGPLAAVPAQGGGAGGVAVPLSVGVNAVVVEVTAADGATKRTVTLSITRAEPAPLDATASRTHLFPLFADGGGFRSRILIADAAGRRARCELTLNGAGLDAVRFAAEPMSALAETADGAGIRFRFRSPGGGVLLDSAGAGELAIGHAKLDCDGPVSAQLLLSLEAGGALSAMAHQSPAERGRAFSLPGLPAPLRLGLAFANDGVRENRCALEAAGGRGVVAVPPGGTAFRLLDEIVALAEGGGTGPVAVRCDRPAALLAVPLAGGAFTTLAPAVLDADGAVDAADEPAGRRSLLPLALDGGGFRSRLSAVNLAAGANRCELRLSAAGGLAGANFGAAADGPEGMDGFALALAGRGAQESLDSRGGEAFAFGHAALECEGPAALWNLIVLDGPDGPAGMMALGPAQPAREMRFRAPPAPARLGLAIANGGGARTACHVALAAADGRAAPPAGFPLISVPARATAIRFLDEMFALPADFAGGAVTLRCDHAVGAVAVPVAGAAFTAVPPIIPGLETVPEAAVDSGGGTPGGTQ